MRIDLDGIYEAVMILALLGGATGYLFFEKADQQATATHNDKQHCVSTAANKKSDDRADPSKDCKKRNETQNR